MTKFLTGLLASIIYSTIATAEITPSESSSIYLKTTLGSTNWDYDSLGISGSSEVADQFGKALAYGNFNGDQWQDLAIGIPSRDFNFIISATNNGLVLILYGSADGLSPTNQQTLSQGFVENGIESSDFFGWSLASGDFNGDGFDDLAVGSPFEDFTFLAVDRNNAGAINIFYGSDSGFNSPVESVFIHQGNLVNNIDAVQPNDQFGFSLVAGDFDNDGIDDLVVSTPNEDLGEASNAGQVSIIFGSDDGITTSSDSMPIAQSSFGIEGDPESGDQFGYSLAAGYFDFNNFLDLAIGVPGERIDGSDGAGAVQVILGGLNGLTNTNTLWSQSGDIQGIPESQDRFGTSIAVGNFNDDFSDDLVVGVPQENIPEGADAGVINIIYGDNSGLTTTNNQIFDLGSPGVGGTPNAADRFGQVLTTGNLNFDDYDDIVIGSPFDGSSDRGTALFLYGSNSGITTVGNEIEFGPNMTAQFGAALAIADFGRGPELAVGLPEADSTGGTNNSGTVEVFRFENPNSIPPQFTATGPFSITEDSIDSAFVGNIDANDGNGGDTDLSVSYSITSGNSNGIFSINSLGILTVANSSFLDFENQSSYNIEVRASDNQMLTTTTPVLVNITNIDEAPVFLLTGPFDIGDTAPNGSFVGLVTANDGDGGSSGVGITYTIIAGNNTGIFSLNNNLGGIFVADSSQLDSDTMPVIILTVEADDGNITSTHLIQINITDELFSDGFELII